MTKMDLFVLPSQGNIIKDTVKYTLQCLYTVQDQMNLDRHAISKCKVQSYKLMFENC